MPFVRLSSRFQASLDGAASSGSMRSMSQGSNDFTFHCKIIMGEMPSVMAGTIVHVLSHWTATHHTDLRVDLLPTIYVEVASDKKVPIALVFDVSLCLASQARDHRMLTTGRQTQQLDNVDRHLMTSVIQRRRQDGSTMASRQTTDLRF